MSPSIRLIATPETGRRTIAFRLAFAAPGADDAEVCAPAVFDAGDGNTIDLGLVCSPTIWTWSTEHDLDLGAHGYDGDGDYVASLRWGEVQTSMTVAIGAEQGPPLPAPVRQPTVGRFEVQAPEPPAAAVYLEVSGLAPDQRLRFDGSVGQVEELHGSEGSDYSVSWPQMYAKPGSYTLALDLLDAEGFWLARLAEQSFDVAMPAPDEPDVTAAAGLFAEQGFAPLLEVPIATAAGEPWLLHRYAAPLWAGTPTYAAPGSTQVKRRLSPGTYLAFNFTTETVVGGQVWYRSVALDWLPASSVRLLTPSKLRGVELRGGTPPPPPPPPPPDTRRGVVTADLLNVRVRPGVQPDNPPVDRLPRGTPVDIYEEVLVGGDRWYRIGTDRWVFAGWVRLLNEASPAPTHSRPGRNARGVVVADALNVRARPGVSPDNPPTARLVAGAELEITQEAAVAGAVWYGVGENQWVHSDWVRLLSPVQAQLAAAAAPVRLPIGFVASSSLNVRQRPGVADDNPPVSEVYRNQSFPILESALAGAETWHRIGTDRWVVGKWLRVASGRLRPAAIGSSERWVGVNLRTQTAVAYEGDLPVYAAMVATGLSGTPTVQGIYRTWARYPSTKMAGPGYYIEGVTWTSYFYRGYALHTAYWHDAFGATRSHGCVNLSPYDAWWLFQWSAPGGPKSPAVYVYAG